MKKVTIFLLVSFLMTPIFVSAQRIKSMTIDGLTSCVPLGYFNPKNNNDTKKGIGEIIYPAGTDLSNVTVSLDAGADPIVSPNPLPTDWTSTVTDIKVEKQGDPNTWAKYDITAKVINPAPLPLEINTGSDGDFDSTSWTTATQGWAGACIDTKDTYKSFIRFSSAKRSFVVAFTDAPDKLTYKIKFNGTWADKPDNVFDIDASEDGMNWTSIVKYDSSNPMPESATQIEDDLDSKYRYVRWVFTQRHSKGGSIVLEDITVTKDTASSIRNIYLKKIGVRFSNVSNTLVLGDNSLVKKLSVYNLAGTMLYSENAPQNRIELANLSAGVYLVSIETVDGVIVSKKILKK